MREVCTFLSSVFKKSSALIYKWDLCLTRTSLPEAVFGSMNNLIDVEMTHHLRADNVRVPSPWNRSMSTKQSDSWSLRSAAFFNSPAGIASGPVALFTCVYLRLPAFTCVYLSGLTHGVRPVVVERITYLPPPTFCRTQL